MNGFYVLFIFVLILRINRWVFRFLRVERGVFSFERCRCCLVYVDIDSIFDGIVEVGRGGLF